MATIITVGRGRFIAGDPDITLHAGNHWCDICDGDGLDYYDDGEGQELTVCGMCSGVGQVECDVLDCTEHPRR